MSTNQKLILLVDDSVNDQALTLLALGKDDLQLHVVVANDGAEALDFLYRRGVFEARESGRPVLVLLDLKMPKVDGVEVLRQLKADPQLKCIPVVMLTSSGELPDVQRCYELGANAYVVKPVDFPALKARVTELKRFWTVANLPPPAPALLTYPAAATPPGPVPTPAVAA